MSNDHNAKVRTAYELGAISSERRRQEHLKVEGRFKYTLADEEMPEHAKLACIMEEVGEVSRNVLARGGFVTDGETGLVELHYELSQIAALSVAWMESLTLLMDTGMR